MNPIKLASTIQNKRREKGITQEDLASYAGVSKAAVSKWENGQSYPDVTLLPILAAYFNISIDELIGYEPQMTKEDIRLLYQRLSRDFSEQPFDQVYTECQHLIAKYYSCFPLILQMGVLLLNHGMLCGDENRTQEITRYARDLFVRVTDEYKDMSSVHQALYLQAYCALQLGEPQEIPELLAGLTDSTLFPDALLAQSWAARGDMNKAVAALQKGSYLSMQNLCASLSQILQYYITDDYHFEETLIRLETLVDTFHLEAMHPGPLLTIYLNIAYFQLQREEIDLAMRYIHKYARLCCSITFPLKLEGDAYFHLLDEWIADLELGSDAPRDSRLVQQDLAETLISNPLFAPLQERIDFKNAVQKIKNHFDPA